jgi:hypothetical protein
MHIRAIKLSASFDSREPSLVEDGITAREQGMLELPYRVLRPTERLPGLECVRSGLSEIQESGAEMFEQEARSNPQGTRSTRRQQDLRRVRTTLLHLTAWTDRWTWQSCKRNDARWASVNLGVLWVFFFSCVVLSEVCL